MAGFAARFRARLGSLVKARFRVPDPRCLFPSTTPCITQAQRANLKTYCRPGVRDDMKMPRSGCGTSTFKHSAPPSASGGGIRAAARLVSQLLYVFSVAGVLHL